MIAHCAELVRAPLWTSGVGCGALASNSMRRHSENAIDETVLPDLTDQDLEKLGVLLGHRRKLLRSESGGLFADVRDVVFMDNLRRFGGVPLPLMGRGICDMRGAA